MKSIPRPIRRSLLPLLVIGLLLALCPSSFALSYYIRSDGNDAAPGTSPDSAWRTFEPVMAHDKAIGFGKSDEIILQEGETFVGPMVLRNVHGSAGHPVVIRSSGARPAVILGRGKGSLNLFDPFGMVINNLELNGENLGDNGLSLTRKAKLADNAPCGEITISNIRAYGFKRHGILIYSEKVGHGFSDVTLNNCQTWNNILAGIEVNAESPYVGEKGNRAHQRIRIIRCQAWSNPGDPTITKKHSGNGIMMGQVEGGTICICKAYNNGTKCASHIGGPYGIWMYACKHVNIFACESCSNSSEAKDGGGFDIDGGCEECALFLNYSHDNGGPGFLVCTYDIAPYSDQGNVVRGNLSVNDVTKLCSSYGPLTVYCDRTDGMTGLLVEYNVIILRHECAAAFHFDPRGRDNMEAVIRRNLLVVPKNTPPLLFASACPRVSFIGNWYFQEGGKFFVLFGEQKLELKDWLDAEQKGWVGKVEGELWLNLDSYWKWFEALLPRGGANKSGPMNLPSV